MRVHDDLMSSDLPILNAEQYIGAADLRPAEKAVKGKKAAPARTAEAPRKRAKTSKRAVVTVVDAGGDGDGDDDNDDDDDEEGDDADEKAKRARGRPRLDTKDQNAADRRRTQIRLAQRAYRSRKENAIQTLEKEVQALQQTKQEMSNAFMKLHDYAVSHGIPDMVPAFAQELHSTTERFLMLAKKPTESGGGDDSRGESTGRESGVSEKAAVKQPEKTSEQDVGEAQPAAMGSSVWGYNFGTQAEIGPDLTVLDPSLPPDAQPSMTPAPLGYEVITMPTLENASFPFDPNAPAYFLAQGAPGAPGATPPIHPSATPNITQPSFSPSIPACLPLPTMAFTETTFGRRLQRSTIELACQLSTMPNPPNDFFARVFGFCMLYEPIENIRVRLHKALEKTSQESLHNWRVPFWAVGGAGQHQFGGSSQQQQEEPQQGNPVGNQGTADVAKHAFGTNFGVGPFDARTTDTRDRQLDASMRIMLPGFQGDFFDPDDVEVYLQSRGVSIEPGQDYVTAEVDLSWFGGEEHGQEQQQAQAQATAMYYDQWAADTPPPPMPPQAAVEETRSGEGVFGATQPVADLLGLGGSTHPLLANTKRIVTLNVDVLIRELKYHGVCLGRTPAYRPKHVNQAFWAATRSDGTMFL